MPIASKVRHPSPSALKRYNQLEYILGRCGLALKFIKSAGFTVEVRDSLTADWLKVESTAQSLLESLQINGENAERDTLFRLEYQTLPHALLLQRDKVHVAIRGMGKGDRLQSTWSFIWRDFLFSDF